MTSPRLRNGRVSGAGRRAVTTLGVLVLVVLAGVVGVLGYAAVGSNRPVTLPAPTGPHAVGRTEFVWTDQSRRDPFTGPGPRELSVVLWYPSAPVARPAASYLPSGWDEKLGDDHGLDSLMRTSPAQVRPHAVPDAPVADDDRYPVLVFAPGLGLRATDYTALAEDLASHGYVVVGVNPTDSTDVVLSGGRVVRAVEQAGDNGDLPGLTRLWADDLRFAADRVRALQTAPNQPLHGHLDTTRIAMFGHSLGGAAATLACRQVDACPAALDIDGALYRDEHDRDPSTRFALLESDDPTALTDDPTQRSTLHELLSSAPADHVHLWRVRGAGHFNFTDRGVCFTALGAELGLLGPIDGTRALTITRAYSRAFFDTYLGARPGGSPPSERLSYPEVRADAVPADVVGTRPVP